MPYTTFIRAYSTIVEGSDPRVGWINRATQLEVARDADKAGNVSGIVGGEAP
jgi:hypothetical protein